MTLYARSYTDTFIDRRYSGVADVVCNRKPQFAYTSRDWRVTTFSKSWWVDSSYHSKVAAGAHLAPNPFLYRKTVLERPFGFTHASYCVPPCSGPSDSSVTGQQIRGVHWGYESDLSDPGLAMVDDATLRARAVNKAILNAKSNLSLLLADFHQRKQTANMIGNNVMRIVNAVRALKHGDFGAAVRSLAANKRKQRLTASDIGQQWLEIQYGWKPILSDVYEAFEAMKPIRAVAKGVGRSKEKAQNSGSVKLSYGTLHYDQQVQKSAKAVLYFTYPGEGALLHGAQQGVLAPLEVAWDLLPWSFVVDWFAPIGDYFQALSASISLQYLDGSTTVKRTASDKRYWDFKRPSCGYSDGRYDWSWEQFQLQRHVESNAVYTFGFKNPYSFTHLANALALLSTSFRGFGGRGR